ncbi:dienelactone hydrolase family protein [Orrella marina]|uniref:Carboxymethylenebutenolidase n=1 Tax=Orrella marina TaxID=2163011 RepID=A0A2R4XJJ4_9BURK|nr:dienelactone hydrolase family protein [Orrella marina]AWB33869.1 carboxymethylenebutenolidase [Orrella marina]
MTNKQRKEDLQGQQWFEDGRALGGTSCLNRRAFLRNTSAVGLLAGFALAAQPVSAQNIITTDTDGLNARQIKLPVKGGEINAYVAQPAQSSGKVPVIVVTSEIFGVHEHIADVARRFAKLGYLAIAPEFFERAGNPSRLESVADIIKTIVSQTPDAQVMDDIRGALEWAQGHGGDMERVGITGFCWGGRITWLACAQIPTFKAGVAWYGRLVGDASDSFPLHPVDVARDLKAPVLGLYGAQDTGIPLATVQQMQDALLKARDNPAAAASRFVIYPDAPHAFHADYRPSYREQAAKDGWDKCLAWFKEHGV